MDKYFNEETKVFHIPEEEPKLNEDGIGCFIFERLKKNGDKVLQIDAETGEEDKGFELLKRSIRVALQMKACGVKENDIISICSHDHINAIVPVIAGTFLGAIPANLDPNFTEKELLELASIVMPKMIFSSLSAYAKILSVTEKIHPSPKVVVFSNENLDNGFLEFLQEHTNEDTFAPIKKCLEDTSVILFSSGTTGTPKGICISGKSLLYNTIKRSPRRVLSYASLYWISSYNCALVAILQGGTKVLCSDFIAEKAWDMYAKFKVNFVLICPYDVSLLLEHQPSAPLEDLQFIGIVGSSICEENLKKFKELVPKAMISSTYGQTENMHIFNPVEAVKMKKPQSVGTPLPEKMYKVVDIDTEEAVGFNTSGELRIKSKYTTTGYYKDALESEKCWDSKGFFKTGDVVYYDRDFCFYIVDRVKESFKRKGWHILPRTIQEVVIKYPGVHEVVVLGIPHKIEDNDILAVVVPLPNYELNPVEIEKFSNEQLDEVHQISAGVRIVKKPPRTPTGKIQIRKLREMVMNGEF